MMYTCVYASMYLSVYIYINYTHLFKEYLRDENFDAQLREDVFRYYGPGLNA